MWNCFWLGKDEYDKLSNLTARGYGLQSFLWDNKIHHSTSLGNVRFIEDPCSVAANYVNNCWLSCTPVIIQNMKTSPGSLALNMTGRANLHVYKQHRALSRKEDVTFIYVTQNNPILKTLYAMKPVRLRARKSKLRPTTLKTIIFILFVSLFFRMAVCFCSLHFVNE